MSADKLPVTQQQVLARRRLSTLVAHKKKELLHYACTYVVLIVEVVSQPFT